MSAQTSTASMPGAGIAAAPSAVLVVYAGALLQGMTLVSFPAVSAMLKQSLALSDADYGAIFLPQVAFAIIGAVAGGALARKIGLRALFALALAANAASQAFLAGSAFASPFGGTVLLLAGTASPLNAALWRLRRRGRGFWVISLDFACVWTRRVGSGLEPEFGVGRVCG